MDGGNNDAPTERQADAVWRTVAYDLDKPMNLESLSELIAWWAERTFPEQTLKTIAAHLISEAAELYKASGGDSVSASAIAYDAKAQDASNIDDAVADVNILSLAAAHYAGIDLPYEVRHKMAVNIKRKWGDVNHLGFHEHVQED